MKLSDAVSLGMIDPAKFSGCKFYDVTETLAFRQRIEVADVQPVGIAVNSRFSSIEVIYVPDDSREIDVDWFQAKAPKSIEDLMEVCRKGFAHYQGEGRSKDVREEFIETIQDSSVFKSDAPALFEQHGYPAFFELGSITFVRAEDAVLYGGCFEDFFHLSEHGVDIALIGDAIEFSGNGDFDYLFESSPYE